MGESLKQKEAELAKGEATFQELKKTYEAKVEETKKSEDLLEALSTGLSAADSEKGFVEQLQQAKNQSTTITAETQQAKLKLGHLTTSLKELEPKMKKMEKENGDAQKTIDEAKKVIAAIEVCPPVSSPTAFSLSFSSSSFPKPPNRRNLRP